MFGGSSTGSGNTKYYEVLGVSKDASTEEVKTAYKKAAIKHHPDKGGDPEKLNEVVQAYKVLSDPKKRPVRGRWSQGGQGQRRGNNLLYTLKVSLEDLYLGTTKKFTFSRNVLCSECNGTVSKSGAPLKCGECGGNGMKVSRMDPMVQQSRLNCVKCDGSGEIISKDNKCPKCEGKRVVPEEKVLEVFVEKGMRHSEKITYNGEANEMPNTITGDVILVIHQQDHPKFKGKNDDLLVEHTLPLSQALCGFQSVLTHLDGRKLLLKANPGDIVKPDSYKPIVDKGMPIYQRQFAKGKLYVHFNVDFPDHLSLKQLEVVKKVLPPKPMLHPLSEMNHDDYEETTLRDVTMEMIQQAPAMDEDGDDDAPCAQQ